MQMSKSNPIDLSKSVISDMLDDLIESKSQNDKKIQNLKDNVLQLRKKLNLD